MSHGPSHAAARKPAHTVTSSTALNVRSKDPRAAIGSIDSSASRPWRTGRGRPCIDPTTMGSAARRSVAGGA
jgi:hypothetical protein